MRLSATSQRDLVTWVRLLDTQRYVERCSGAAASRPRGLCVGAPRFASRRLLVVVGGGSGTG